MKSVFWQEVLEYIQDDQGKNELKGKDWIVAGGLIEYKYDDLVGLITTDDVD